MPAHSSPSLKGRLKPWQKTALVGLAYALLVGIMTWPAISALGQRLIGDNEDAWIFFWNNWWLREALTSGSNLFETSYLFYPEGTSLVAHSSSFLTSFLALLFEPFTSPVVSYNLVFMLGLWVGALGMYLLVDDITGHKPASFLAGFVFAFAPYHISQALAHAHLGSIHWWPFFILFFRRALNGRRWRDAAAAGAFGAITIWTGLQLAIFLALWAILYLLWFVWNHRIDISSDSEYRARFLSRFGAVLLVTLLLSMPFLVVLISNWSLVSGGTTLFIGFSVIVLAAAAAWGWRKKAAFWLLSAGLWLLMAAGPALRINGALFDQLPLPYKWLGAIFPLSTIRAPDRFNLLLVLSMAVLSGMGVAYLARFRYMRWVLIPISLFLFIEYLFIPIPTLKIPESSQLLFDIAEDEGTDAIVDYPLGYTPAKYWLYFQTVHGRPTVDGHVSRYTSETYDFLASQPLLNALYEGGEVARYLPNDFFEGQRESPIRALGPTLRDLRESGIRYIMVHLPFASEERIEHFKTILPLAPAYQDDLLIAYDLAQLQLYSFDPFPIPIGSEIDLVQVVSKISDDGSALEIELLTQMTASEAGYVECRVVLGENIGSSPFTAFSREINWKEGDLSRVIVELPIPTDIPIGQYSWQISCPGTTSVPSAEYLLTEQDDRALLSEKLQLTFDGLIELEGYRKWFEGGDLHIELQWLALSAMSQDYKVFLHLLDEAGDIVRQSDFIHCRGGCPTGQWDPGQQIDDETSLSLAGLPEGEYRLAVGLYNGENGQRLEARDRFGQIVPEAYTILDSTIKINGNRLMWPDQESNAD